MQSCKSNWDLLAGFGPNFEKNFEPNSGLSAELSNKRLSTSQFQVVSNFGFAKAKINRVKSDEYTLVGNILVYTIIHLSCHMFSARYLYWLCSL